VRDGVVGIRVPSHPFFQRVMALLALPLFGTSVNRHGEPAMADIDQIIDRFSAVDLIITGPTGGIASDIINLATVPPRAVRGNLPPALQESDSLSFF
jgi:tRNA A37 threonylcarbamoyladenosine synthetase subunit TsaC/SUA5/YrdC